MPAPILYLGDTSLDTAAAYLAGVLHHFGWSFDYVASDEPATSELFEAPRSLYILSDYPSAMLQPPLQQMLLQHVRAGAGLLMIGGWESFHGIGGDWENAPLAEALPVMIGDADDRLNCDQPLIVKTTTTHPILADLPWDSRPPLVGGLNRITPKSEAVVVLEAQQFDLRRADGAFQFEPTQVHPLLVVGEFGQGKTAALATDVAPHWVGPLVDWGPARVTAQAPGAGEVEVGSDYAQFLRQLIGWLAEASD